MQVGMQTATAPPGPAMYVENSICAPRAGAPVDMLWSQKTALEHVLNGLGPMECERIRSRNGLDANGPWEEVEIVCVQDVREDIRDFEKCLRVLVRLESGADEDGDEVCVPRMNYIREVLGYTLEPLCHSMPELFDMDKGVFCEIEERDGMGRQVAALLRAFHACPMLSMSSVELHAYLGQRRKTAEQMHETLLFVRMSERYIQEYGV
jgi:hypothetical protein